MHRPSRAALACVLLLAGCKIERTPSRILDPGAEAQQERLESQAELQTRLVAFREALGRGDRSAALAALNPHPDARVLAPGADSLPAVEAEATIASLLDGLIPGEGTAVTAPDLRVTVDGRRNTGWFSTHLNLAPAAVGDTLPRRMGLSGVFSREEGDWRLVLVHLSHAPVQDPAVADAAAADSARADTATAQADSARAGR